jgi:hypothetical protein
LKGVAGVFSYSKTKGLFAGVSIEGSVLVERRDANEKLYNSRITARQLLEGGVRPPPEADPLMRVLNSKIFAGIPSTTSNHIYNDIPIYDESLEGVEGRSRPTSGGPQDYEYRDRPSRTNTWHGNSEGAPSKDVSVGQSYGTRANPTETFDNLGSRRPTVNHDSKPGRPTAPKPQFKPKPTLSTIAKDQAVALYAFEATQPGDLGFKKGEVITITKRTESATDWWTGRIGNREGIFPR